MPIPKAERLMNLALCLMNTRRPLSKRELRLSIEAYHEDTAGDATDDAAFNRMFERDKEDLRELGLVIETGESNTEGEVGYLARRASNRLPEVALTAEEAAALNLAARVWQQARFAEAASGALQKLRAAGVDFDGSRTSVLEPRIPTREAAFEKLMLATRQRHPVSFTYRRSGAAEPASREVEPWALEHWHGHWYLAGHDRDRKSVRVFKLSRIEGPVRTRGGAFREEIPDHVDVREHVARFAGEGATATARIRLRRGSGYPLRVKAVYTEPVDAEWDELEVPYGHGLDANLVEFGSDVLVVEPAELRDAVIARLCATAGVPPRAGMGRASGGAV